jgi:hypothetical protein
MIFLNVLFLLGLAGITVPLLIHLLNRVRARPVEWGAMRFLRQSLNVRRRRMLLEEALVLATRCLIVAFLALALARPFIRPGSLFPPWMILSAILLPVVMTAMGAVFWSDPAKRRLILRCAGLLLIAAAATAWWETRRGGPRWQGGAGEKDIVIILDASASMGLKSDGRTTFDRAIDEALALVDRLPRSDSVGLIWAGPAPKVSLHPTVDRSALKKILNDETLRPSGGTMGALEAFYAAAGLLEEGRNPDKVVLFITDGHRAGWDYEGERRWSFLAERMSQFPVKPRLLIRRLPMPAGLTDAMVADITLSRSVIGTDRPVSVVASIANAGSRPVRPGTVELRVDGVMVGRSEVRQEIPVNAVEQVRFSCPFERPGRHLLEVTLGFADDSPANNTACRAVDVLDRLKILLVDGAPHERFFRGAAGFFRVALTPETREPEPATGGTAAVGPLIRADVKSVRDFSSFANWSDYQVIVLANVPRLSPPVAARLASYVEEGGGLLIAPGERAETDFYNEWRSVGGGHLTPARLVKRVVAEREEPFRMDPPSCSHPALRIPAESMPRDYARFLSSVCWELEADPSDRDVRIGGRFVGGMPLLAERAFGYGRILMTAIAMDRRDSNFPTLKSFVPFTHELAYDLAAVQIPLLHIKPGDELAIRIDGRRKEWNIDPAAVVREGGGRGVPVEVWGPASNKLAGMVVAAGAQMAIVRCSDTVEPGLYKVRLPPAITGGQGGELAFSVSPSAEEAKTDVLSDSDLDTARSRIGLIEAMDRAALMGGIDGKTPGRETWRTLALMALVGLMVETGLTRWVAIRRQTAPAAGRSA